MATMIWVGVALAALAMAGIVTAQIYMRAAYRPAARRRAIEHFVIVCAGLAVFGYGLAALDCLSSRQCVVAYKRDSSHSGWVELLR